jgi:outer membrane lipase/esterase
MRAFRTLLSPWVLSSTLLLAACGGSDPDVPGSGSPSGAPTTAGQFTAVVSFGDSLSDVGSYSPATSLTGDGAAPYFGGRFTTNDTTTGAPTATPLGKVWVENLAAALGLIVTPAEVGFGSTSVQCPAAAVPALATTCTAYGQGGSRVTDPNGIGKSGGALTVPLVTQVANHLARFGSFTSGDLILVYGGNNDALIQFGAFAATAAQIQADAAAGLISADRANLELFSAQQVAQEAMKTAALELATLVKTQILANGGTYVAVMTLSDIADTPFGNSPSVVPARSVLSALSETFNLWLREGLTGQPVQIIDTWALYKDGYANPGNLGIVNNTTAACDAAKIQAVTGGAVTDGSSLFCNATPGAPYNTIVTGADVNTWQFADSVHPTTGGHKIISDAFAAQLHAFGWI